MEGANPYDVETKPKAKGGLFSFLGRKKRASANDDQISIEEADDGSVEAGFESEKKKYRAKASRVPSLIDAAGKDVVEDEEEEEILKDPYSEIMPMSRQEPPMKDEEEDEADRSGETTRFAIALTSKVLFLIGSIFFLLWAVQDYQRLQGSSPSTSTEASNEAAFPESPTPTVDDDVDPFVVGNFSNSADFEAAKEERTGSIEALAGNGRRRVQKNWYTEYWDSLPADIQEQAELLGYDRETWDAGKSVKTDRLHWNELDEPQKVAAYNVFGYTEETWNEYVDRFLASLPPSLAPSSAPQDLQEITATLLDDPEDAPDPFDGEDMGGSGGEAATTHESGGSTGGNNGEVGPETTEGTNGNGDEADASVSAFENGYNVDFSGEPRDETFKIFYVSASVCFVLVGIMDAIHQQLGFHLVMVLGGISGILAGAFSTSNEEGFNVCNSLSAHFFVLQAVLVIYSRLLLTYDASVRRAVTFADGLFAMGAVIETVVSYMRFNNTTSAMTTSALAASVFWCIAGVIYIACTILLRRTRTSKNRIEAWGTGGGTAGDVSVHSCNVVEDEGEVEACEISLADGDARL